MKNAWKKIDRRKDGCWIWKGSLRNTGYGVLQRNGKNIPTHRFFYENLVGEIPPGLEIDHLCRNRACVNPDHLEPVSPRINKLRGEGVGAKNARKTHCPAGHLFSGKNLKLRWHRKKMVWWRECKECRLKNGREYENRFRSGKQPRPPSKKLKPTSQ